MQPVNPGTGAKRRKALLDLYNAALGVTDARNVLLERGPTQLYPGKKAMPEPTAADPDNDGDGLPDNATHQRTVTVNKVKQTITETYAEKFDLASHIHIDKNPVDGGDDD